MVEKAHPALFVVDNLQLIQEFSGDDHLISNQMRNARQLQTMTEELGVPFLAISRLTGNHCWFDSDPVAENVLRECGPLEHTADTLLFLHRAECRKPKTKRKGMADLIVARHRRGPPGAVKLAFDGRYARFSPRDASTSISAD
jgi:replicative DNA helicase